MSETNDVADVPQASDPGQEEGDKADNKRLRDAPDAHNAGDASEGGADVPQASDPGQEEGEQADNESLGDAGDIEGEEVSVDEAERTDQEQSTLDHAEQVKTNLGDEVPPCSEFTRMTLGEQAGTSVPPEMRDQINNRGFSADDVQDLVDNNDPQLGGVAHALSENGWGEMINDSEQVQEGDYVQYWGQREDGSWTGHQGIVDGVQNSEDGTPQTFTMYSASSEGIGHSDTQYTFENSNDHRVYFGRYTGTP